MKKALLGSILALCVLVTAVDAGEVWWGGGSGDWSTSANWGGGNLPGALDQACINNTVSPYPTLSSGTYTIYDLLDGYWNDGGMTISGGSLTINNVFATGYKGAYGVTSNATFTMNGGTINTPYQWVGYSYDAAYPINGTFTMGGGTINVTYILNVGGGTGNTVGQLNLNGGEIDLGNFSTINIASGSKITVSGSGKLRIYASGEKAKVVSYVENGKIVAGAGYKLKVSFGPGAPINIEAVSSSIVDSSEMWWGTPWQTPAGGNGNWAFPGNWGRGYVPGATDYVYINQGVDTSPSFPVVSTGSQVANTISIGDWGYGKLTVSGGTLTTGSNISVGNRGDGTFNISGTGGVSVGGQLKIGYKGPYGASGNGDVNMVGGSLTTADEIAVGMESVAFGKFILKAGSVTAPSLYVGRWGPGSMTMNGGTASIANVLGVSVGSYDANVVMYNGTITDVQQTWIGYHPTDSYAHGTLDLRGGNITSKWNLNIGYAPYSTGELNIYGGTYTHWCDISVDDGSRINVMGGQLIIENRNGQNMNTMYDKLVVYRDGGKLVAYGGGVSTVVHIDKDSPVAGQIRVWGENLAPQAQASNPRPDGIVYNPVTLQWLQGIGAVTQNIYVGTDQTAVTNAATASPEYKGPVAGSVASYIPTMLIGQTYYWRIDTVKTGGTVVTGAVWSFTVGGYLVLEDCQSYTTTATNWSAAGSGAVVLDSNTTDLGYKWGYQHGKAVELSYNNVSTAYAEAIYTMPTIFNTTLYNAAILRLDIHGDASNVGATEPLSVILEDSAGHRSKAVLYSATGVNKDLVQEKWEPWYSWMISLGDFTQSGFDAANVKKVIVHIGGTVASGAHGKITIDDIRIYPPICTAEHILYGDFTYDCKVDISDLFAIARDWLMGPETITAAAPITPPILWYKFNESSGAVANDEIANNDGTLRNGPTWVAGGGPDGTNCINIHGGRTAGSYGVSVPASVFSSITDTISFSLWVKGDATNPVSPTGNVFTGSNNETSVWDTASGVPGAISTKIYFQAPFESGIVNFGAGLTLPNSYDYISWNTAFISDWRGVWVHYALVKDGATGTMEIYRNGELVSNMIEGATKPITDIQYFWIGATQLFGYEGMIDDFRIYNYALTPEQVVSLAGKASITQPILNWRSDAGGDGKVNFVDFAAMASKWLNGEQLWPRN